MFERGARDLTGDDAKLFIGNLSYHTREERLQETFGKYGIIKECRVALEPGSERSRGYAFVTMDDPHDALLCVKNISGQDVDGRLIKVEIATGVRGSASSRRGGDRDRYGGGRDRDFTRDSRGRGRDSGRERSRDNGDGKDSKGSSWDKDTDPVLRERERERSRDRDGGRDMRAFSRDQDNSRNRSKEGVESGKRS